MSLRQEIQDRIILMLAADWGGTEKETTDDILKLFEKRIDARIREYTMHPFAEVSEVIAELEDIKKEMLK